MKDSSKSAMSFEKWWLVKKVDHCVCFLGSWVVMTMELCGGTSQQEWSFGVRVFEKKVGGSSLTHHAQISLVILSFKRVWC